MAQIIIKCWQSPAGELMLGSYGEKLCLLDWTARKDRERVDRRLQNALNSEYVEGTSAVIEDTMKALKAYFAKECKIFDIPLLMIGSDFQRSVWEALLRIPYGRTASYLDLARSIGNERAVRAAASAVGANAISIVIPCHRVIGSDGTLTGYAGGLDVKKKLLGLEAKDKKY